jgi:hypothetical protein
MCGIVARPLPQRNPKGTLNITRVWLRNYPIMMSIAWLELLK